MPGPLTKPPVQHGAGTAVTQPTAHATVNAAAQKWGIPADVLWGVYGIETSFGSNVKTSSAGAVGPFQFIPSTAHAYNYPLTNTPNADQFAQQADSAAHYLHTLITQHHGNLDAALRAYSGGGYGQAEVHAMATGKQAQAFDAPTRAGSIARSVSDAASLPGKLFDLLTSAQTWIRVVEIVAGVALLLMALKSFTGGTVDPVGTARRMVPVL